MFKQQVTVAPTMILWWYDWGVFLLTFVAIALIGWVFYSSRQRRTPATTWQLLVSLPALLIVPSLIMRVLGTPLITSAHLLEPFFYLGVLGGVVSILAAIGYALTAGQAAPAQTMPPPPPPPRRQEARPTERVAARRAPARKAAEANAMLYVHEGPRSGTDYRLNVGTTNIGRSKDNDIWIDHPEVSGQHAMIREEEGRFTLVDRGSTNGTYLNGQLVRSPTSLEDGDQIALGEVVTLVFKAF
jgi:hypothetical protein